jgi:hypothetical protein
MGDSKPQQRCVRTNRLKNKNYISLEKPEGDLQDIKKLNFMFQCANAVGSSELSRFYAANTKILVKRQLLRVYVSR